MDSDNNKKGVESIPEIGSCVKKNVDAFFRDLSRTFMDSDRVDQTFPIGKLDHVNVRYSADKEIDIHERSVMMIALGLPYDEHNRTNNDQYEQCNNYMDVLYRCIALGASAKPETSCPNDADYDISPKFDPILNDCKKTALWFASRQGLTDAVYFLLGLGPEKFEYSTIRQQGIEPMELKLKDIQTRVANREHAIAQLRKSMNGDNEVTVEAVVQRHLTHVDKLNKEHAEVEDCLHSMKSFFGDGGPFDLQGFLLTDTDNNSIFHVALGAYGYKAYQKSINMPIVAPFQNDKFTKFLESAKTPVSDKVLWMDIWERMNSDGKCALDFIIMTGNLAALQTWYTHEGVKQMWDIWNLSDKIEQMERETRTRLDRDIAETDKAITKLQDDIGKAYNALPKGVRLKMDYPNSKTAHPVQIRYLCALQKLSCALGKNNRVADFSMESTGCRFSFWPFYTSHKDGQGNEVTESQVKNEEVPLTKDEEVDVYQYAVITRKISTMLYLMSTLQKHMTGLDNIREYIGDETTIEIAMSFPE